MASCIFVSVAPMLYITPMFIYSISCVPLYFSSFWHASDHDIWLLDKATVTAITSSILPMSWSVVSRSRRVRVPFATASERKVRSASPADVQRNKVTHRQSRWCSHMVYPIRRFERTASQYLHQKRLLERRRRLVEVWPLLTAESLAYAAMHLDIWRKSSQISLIKGVNSEFALRGTIKHLMGATTGGRDSTCCKNSQYSRISVEWVQLLTPRATSLSRAQ